MSIWLKDGLSHITPKGLENPEGFNVKALLADMVNGDHVLDFGCGRGRLAGAFSPDKYTGFDINPEAVKHASNDNPDHFFSDVMPTDSADVTLMYTVALHIPDSCIADTLNSLDSKRVIIAEIMREDMARPDGIPPAFNRSPDEYRRLMKQAGYKLSEQSEADYSYYPCAQITFQEYSRIGN